MHGVGIQLPKTDVIVLGDVPIHRVEIDSPHAARLADVDELLPPVASQRDNSLYYDAEGDRRDAARYYRGLTIGEDGGRSFQELSYRLYQTHHSAFAYGDMKSLFFYPRVDVHPDGALRCVYTGRPLSRAVAILSDIQAESELGLRGIPSPNEVLDGLVAGAQAAVKGKAAFNVEHLIPQSAYERALPMRSDMHLIFTAHPETNFQRSNLPIGEHANDGEVFVPTLNRGAIARSILYFLVRYPGLVDESWFAPNAIDFLPEWSTQDPPSLWERHRNAESAEIQGVRNPLIDHPEWVNRIEFSRGFKR